MPGSSGRTPTQPTGCWPSIASNRHPPGDEYSPGNSATSRAKSWKSRSIPRRNRTSFLGRGPAAPRDLLHLDLADVEPLRRRQHLVDGVIEIRLCPTIETYG